MASIGRPVTGTLSQPEPHELHGSQHRRLRNRRWSRPSQPPVEQPPVEQLLEQVALQLVSQQALQHSELKQRWRQWLRRPKMPSRQQLSPQLLVQPFEQPLVPPPLQHGSWQALRHGSLHTVTGTRR